MDQYVFFKNYIIHKTMAVQFVSRISTTNVDITTSNVKGNI